MFTNLTAKKVILGIAGLLAIVLLLVASTFPAFADSPEPVPAKNITDRTANRILTSVFRHQQTWVNEQQKLVNGRKVIEMRDTFVNMMNNHKAAAAQIAEHKAAFESYIAQGRESQSLARALLDDHKGFAADGSVIDRNTAILTLNAVEQCLLNVKHLAKNAKNESTLARQHR